MKRNGTLILFYLMGLIVFGFFLFQGADYYATPLIERPHHPDYGRLRPAGSLGLFFGITGASCLLGLLLYCLRKRTRLFGRLFSLKYWLDGHILMGVVGPLFVLLHTSFKLGGLVSLSFWTMVGVAVSGVVGRFLYAHIPHNDLGEEIGIDALTGLTPPQRQRLLSIQRVFHHWHVIHRPFALIMYLIMILHIGVALMFGIMWR